MISCFQKFHRLQRSKRSGGPTGLDNCRKFVETFSGPSLFDAVGAFVSVIT